MSTLARYRKTVAALLTLIATWGGTALIDGGVDGVEWFGLLGAFGAALVYGVPNDTPTGQAPDPAMSERDT